MHRSLRFGCENWECAPHAGGYRNRRCRMRSWMMPPAEPPVQHLQRVTHHPHHYPSPSSSKATSAGDKGSAVPSVYINTTRFHSHNLTSERFHQSDQPPELPGHQCKTAHFQCSQGLECESNGFLSKMADMSTGSHVFRGSSAGI